MLWLFYILLQALAWNYPLRNALFPDNPVVHLPANAINDLLWLPLAVLLPVHLYRLIGRLDGAARAWMRGGLTLLVIVLVVDVSLFFRLFFVQIVLFFLLWGRLLARDRRLEPRYLFLAIALVFMIAHYQFQLLPKPPRKSSGLTIMSFNMNTGLSRYDDERTMLLLKQYLPDVVCLQECQTGEISRMISAMKGLYPYALPPGRWRGTADVLILSRLPFVEANNFKLKTEAAPGRIVNHAVINYGGTPIHLVNAHLTHSTRFFAKWMKSGFDHVKRAELQQAYHIQQQEARLFVEHVEALNGPVIVCGDLNEPPNGAVYRLMRRRFRNVFARRGWGIGCTYGKWTLQKSLPPFLRSLAFHYLRIDHIFLSQHFRIIDAQVLRVGAFDHQPQMAKLVLKK